jgi:hypothetical protein
LSAAVRSSFFPRELPDQRRALFRERGDTLLQAHAAADCFPLLDDVDLAELAEDIRAHGLQHPIVTYRGQILDGRNRYRACSKLGIEPKCVEWDGKSHGGSPTSYVVSENLKRRHLTPSQRAVAAVEVEPLYAAEAAQNKGGRPPKDATKPPAVLPEVSRENREARTQAAKVTGASPRNVSKAKRVKEASPEMYEKVKSGAVTVNQAEQMVAAERKRSPRPPKEEEPAAPADAPRPRRMPVESRVVLERVITTMGGACAGLVDIDFNEIDPAEIPEHWLADLRDISKRVAHLIRKLSQRRGE